MKNMEIWRISADFGNSSYLIEVYWYFNLFFKDIVLLRT